MCTAPRLLNRLLQPEVVPWVYHRGIDVPLSAYDPKRPGLLWASPSAQGYPTALAASGGGFVLRRQLPTVEATERPALNQVRATPRSELVDDRLFLLAIGFNDSAKFDTDPRLRWVPYEKAVEQQLIAPL